MFFNNPKIKKKILCRSEEEKQRIEKKINEIQTHQILNLNFLDQFFFFIFETENQELIIRLFKKKYDLETQDWDDTKLNLITSIKLNFDIPKDDIYNIDNLENPDFIKKNEIEIDDIEYTLFYPFDVKEKDIEFYNYQQYNLIDVDELFEKNTLVSEWGYELNYKDVRWMISIENGVNCNYGNKKDNIVYFRSKTFKKYKFIDLYYQNIDRNSILYKNILKNISFICDLCDDNFNNLEESNLWHNPKFGDLCNQCMDDKKYKEDYRKYNIKKLLLQKGKKKIFEKELIKTKLYLVKNKKAQLPLLKKNNLINKIFRNTLNILDKKYNTCSICLENMEEEIYSGNCGHCFHKHCILNSFDEQCPLCRKYTPFFKLYLE